MQGGVILLSIVYIIENSNLFTSEEIAFMSKKIPDNRLERAERYHHTVDKNNCIAACFLLRYGLLKSFGIKALPEIVYNKYRKPFFKDSGISFSISHSGTIVCCGISEGKIGVDVQDIVSKYQDILYYVMSTSEVKIINASKSPAADFTEFWTFKESYCKYLGTGIWDSLSDLDFSDVSGGVLKYNNINFRSEPLKDCFITACSDAETPLFIRKNVSEFIAEYKEMNGD